MKRFFILLAALTALGLIGCPNESQEDNKTQTNADKSDTKITTLQAIIDSASDNSIVDLSQYSNYTFTNYNAVINKTLTLNANQSDFGNASLTVSSDKVELNGIANASVTAAASLGSGSLKISSSSLSSLTIYGGGMHSIYILDVSVDTITIDQSIDSYREDIVRLVYDASTDFNSLFAYSDMLLYYDGEGAAPAPAIDASKIKTAHNVNVAANTAIDSSDSTSVASVKLPDDSSPSLYVLANSSDTLSEALLNQSIAYITKDSDLALEASNVRIDYTQSVRDGAEYTIAERNKYEFIFDFDGTAENTYILHNKTTEQKTVPTNIKNGQMSPRYITQVSDKDGNIYMTYNSLDLKALIIVAFTYSELCKMEETGEGAFSYYSIVDTTDDELLPILDKQYIRLAMYEKGATKHLFVLQTQLWDEAEEPRYRPNVICVDVKKGDSVNTFKFNQIGMDEISIDSHYMFGQAIAVDKDENLYIGENKFEGKSNESKETYLDFGSSVVNKYYFAPLKEGGTNQFGYTKFNLELKTSKPYGDFINNTIYDVTEPIANPTLYRILSNYSFGIDAITPEMISQF